MQSHGQALFGRVPTVIQKPAVQRRRPADNEAKIEGLRRLASIIEDCRLRGLAGSIRLIGEREKAVLTRTIALNKLVRIIHGGSLLSCC